MTNEEAIETIKTAIAEIEWEYPMNYATAFDMAIEALEKQPKWWKQQLPEPYNEGISNTADDEAQTTDAEPVNHGRWEAGVTCSKCGFIRQITGSGNLMIGRYCPYCGAKMDLNEGESE